MSTVLEQLQTTGFKVVVRDTQTGQTRTLRLVGQGPWDLDAETAIDINGDAGPRPQATVAPPPDSAITLRIACTREDTRVRIGATGSGAKAWTAHQRTLLGAQWQLDAQGAPFALLEKTPTLLDDLRAAHPDAAIDTADCQDTDLLYSGRTASDTAARHSAGRAGRRGEKAATEAPAAAETPTPAPAQVVAEPETRPDPPAKRHRRKREKPAAGPGELTWSPITENGVEGFSAPWKDGVYKLLHVAGDAYGLFYEREAGGYDMILCGDLDEAKAAAAEHMSGMPVSQVARAACAGKSSKAPCRSPRTTRVHSAEELRTRYFTPRYEKAFKDAIDEGMSLCADLDGLQTHSDLSVTEALELLRERGEGAVYALENVHPEAPRRTPAEVADKPRLSIHYSIAGETTSGPLVNVTLLLHVGASDPVLFQSDGVQLYDSPATQPENLLESLFQDVIDQSDAKLLRKLGKFIMRVLPSEKFGPADFELSESNQDRDLAEELVHAITESVILDMKKQGDTNPPKVPAAAPVQPVSPARAPTSAAASAPSTEPAPAPTSAGDKALIDSFAAALSTFEEDD